MKRLLLAAVIIFFAQLHLKAQQGFNINGVAKQIKTGEQLKLVVPSDKGNDTLSAVVKGEKFQFKGKIPHAPALCYLFLASKNPSEGINMLCPLFLDNSTVSVIVTKPSWHDNPVVKGSVSHADYDRYLLELKPLTTKLEQLDKEMYAATDKVMKIGGHGAIFPYFKENSVGIKKIEEVLGATLKTTDSTQLRKAFSALRTKKASLQKQLNDLYLSIAEAKLKYALNHPNSFYTPYLQLQLLAESTYRDRFYADASPLQNAYAKFSAAVKNSGYGLKLKAELLGRDKLALGKQAPQITGKTAEGKEINLKDVVRNNRLTLLDFWASWCTACRMDNKENVPLYHKYKDKGFGAVGFSLDRPAEAEAWKTAIKADQLPWLQFSDLMGFKSPVAKAYSLNVIPVTYLLDLTGKILAKNLRGKALEKKVEELLDSLDGRQGFTLHGKINGIPDGEEVIWITNYKKIKDSVVVKVKDEEFTIKSKIIGPPDFSWLRIGSVKDRRIYVPLFFINGVNLELTGNFKEWPKVTVKGSPENDQLSELYTASNAINAELQQINQEIDALSRKGVLVAGDAFNSSVSDTLTLNIEKGKKVFKDSLLTADAAGVKQAFAKLQARRRVLIGQNFRKISEVNQLESESFSQHNDSFYSLWILSSKLNQRPDSATIQSLVGAYEYLSERIKTSIYGLEFKQKLDKAADDLTKFGLGKTAPNFSAKTSDGNNVELKQVTIKNKLTLIDFWASWCHPCREETPFIKEVYNTYKSKGFDVLGISIDNKPDLWKKALAEDKMPWMNLLSEFEKSENAQSIYGVYSIPTNYLIDGSGKIVGKNLRGKALMEAVKNVLGNPSK